MGPLGKDTLPETNSKFAPENGWLEYKPFLLGRLGLFSGAFDVSFREGNCNCRCLLAPKLWEHSPKKVGEHFEIHSSKLTWLAGKSPSSIGNMNLQMMEVLIAMLVY